MPKKTHFLETDAQTVLDELWAEKLIPLKLNVGKFTVMKGGYTIDFHDSRIHSVRIPLAKGRPWKEVVREAVLERVRQMSGPLAPDRR